jgi:hypothetical protein
VSPPPLALASRSTPQRIYLPRLATSLDDARLVAALPPQDRPSVKRPTSSTGISTGCPSAPACAYALGPTNPPRITLAAEPSGFRWWGFAPHFSVTRSGIRTRGRSSAAHATPSLHPRRSPTKRAYSTRFLGFGRRLCPAGLSARRHSTSELLRTLSRMAASKPTSWLFAHRHILCHSAAIWGP